MSICDNSNRWSYSSSIFLFILFQFSHSRSQNTITILWIFIDYVQYYNVIPIATRFDALCFYLLLLPGFTIFDVLNIPGDVNVPFWKFGVCKQTDMNECMNEQMKRECDTFFWKFTHVLTTFTMKIVLLQ